MNDIAVKVNRVSKSFKLPHEKTTSIKSAVVNFYRRNRTYEEQEALKDISFEIKKGEFFGIIGRNGSGKSTLLKLLAGIYAPTNGQITINGRLTPFIELGVGFNQELTGRENVFLNGALLGFSRSEIKRMYDDIVTFAELERFMDQKLKNYSSGMQVRLAFSIAIRAKSDILLIDEVLAVGDAAFQSKCFDYFQELKDKNVTVVFVSHDRGSLERFCDKGVLINEGKVVKAGNIRDVLKSYSTIVLNELSNETDKPVKSEKRSKPEYALIRGVKIIGADGLAKKKIVYGEKLTAHFEVKVLKDISNPVMGITVWQKNVNKAIYATNTLIERILSTGYYKAGDTIEFDCNLPSLLNDGEYYLEPAIANQAATVFYDQQSKAATFIINGSGNPHSIVAQSASISVTKQPKISKGKVE